MDALALLCTLHADGPTTLKRLRELDCSALRGLYSLDLASLAWALESEQGSARRFLQEGLILLERMESEECESRPSLEPKAQPAPASTTELEPKRASTDTERSGGSILPLGFVVATAASPAQSEPRPVHRAAPGTSRSSGRPAGYAAGAQAPKTRAADLPSELPRNLAAPAGASQSAAPTDSNETPQPSLPQVPAPAPPSNPVPAAQPRLHQPESILAHARQDATPKRVEPRMRLDLNLREGLIEGLNQGVCRALASAGVVTLVELADCANLQLARRLGVPFAKLLELELLAQRLLKAPNSVEQATQAVRAKPESPKPAPARDTQLDTLRPATPPEQAQPTSSPKIAPPKIAPSEPAQIRPEAPKAGSVIVPLSPRPEHLPARRSTDRREPLPKAKPDESKLSQDTSDSGSAGPFA